MNLLRPTALRVLTCLIAAAAVVPQPLLAQQADQHANKSLTLRPGDLVRVKIWREDDLSGEFRVDELGFVTLPLIGEKDVNGVPMRELRDRLISEYRVQLRNPSITITPLRQIHLLGHVNQPGLYAIDPTFSLAGAIALAGGASGAGDLRRIRIVRDGEVVHDAVQAESTLATVDIRSGDQIFVGRRGWFERHQNFLITTMISVTALIIRVL